MRIREKRDYILVEVLVEVSIYILPGVMTKAFVPRDNSKNQLKTQIINQKRRLHNECGSTKGGQLE